MEDVAFSVAPGECVGLAGLAGSGKDEIGEVLAGLRVPAAGSVTVAGESLRMGHPPAVQRQGIGYVPRDRHVRGNLPQLSIAENVTVTIGKTFGRFGFVSPRRQTDKARVLMHDLGVVASSPAQPVAELSGGNQQKCLMARALASKPKVLVLVAPTQGVDIASKNALFGIVAKEQAEGTAVLVISDELDELSICDRIAILFRGRITAQFGATRDDHRLVAAIEGLEDTP